MLLLPIGSVYVVYNIFILNADMNNKQYINEAVISSLILLFINIIMFSLYSRLSKEKELQRYNTVYAQQLELCTQHMKEKETVAIISEALLVWKMNPAGNINCPVDEGKAKAKIFFH